MEKLMASFNSTLIILIPKKDNPLNFEYFFPISLCKCIYKIIAKSIAKRIKKLLSKSILRERFGFLEGRQIHESIWISQEGLQNIKLNKLKAMILKMYLSKEYDKVSWLYLRMMLSDLGFGISFKLVEWCVAYLLSLLVS